MRLAVLGCGRAAALAGRALRGMRRCPVAFASRDPARAARLRARARRRTLRLLRRGASLVRRRRGARGHAAGLPPRARASRRSLPASTSCSRSRRCARRRLDRRCGAARHGGQAGVRRRELSYKPLLRAAPAARRDGRSATCLFIHVNAIKKQRRRSTGATIRRARPRRRALRGRHPLGRLHGEPRPRVARRPRAAGRRASRGVERSMLVSFDYAKARSATLSYSVGGAVDARRACGCRRSTAAPARSRSRPNGLWVLLRTARSGSTFPGCAISRATARCGRTSSGRWKTTRSRASAAPARARRPRARRGSLRVCRARRGRH